MNNSSVSAAAAKPRQLYKSSILEAFKTSLSTMPGIFAWGMVTGMAMVKSGLTVWQALGMTFVVFAGSAQLAALPLIVAHTPVWVVFITACVVNLRFMIFGVALNSHFSHLPWYKRIWYGYFTTDIVIAYFPTRFPPDSWHDSNAKVGFFAGIGYSNWYFWQVGSVLGILLASQIPESWGIGFAGTLALLGLLIPLTINRAALAGVIVASAVSVAAVGMPYRLGILLAVILGIAAAMTVDTMTGRSKDRNQDQDRNNP